MTSSIERLRPLRDCVQGIPASIKLTYEALAAQKAQVEALARDIQRYDVDVAGIGGSLLPAEYLRNQLGLLGYSACQREASYFLTKQVPSVKNKILIVFSQSLSPNARLALTHRAGYEQIYVICASAKARKLVQGVQYLQSIYHAPLHEEGGLVRIQGPINACLVVRAVVNAIARQRRKFETEPVVSQQVLFEGVYRMHEETPPLDNVLALLAPAQYLYAAQAFAWRLQECMQRPGPPAYDFLAFAHGPLQANFNRPGRFLFFETASTPASWRTRIESALNPRLHELTVLQSFMSKGIELFHWDWQLWPAIIQEMNAAGVDPTSWAGQNQDASLYDLGSSEPDFSNVMND